MRLLKELMKIVEKHEGGIPFTNKETARLESIMRERGIFALAPDKEIKAKGKLVTVVSAGSWFIRSRLFTAVSQRGRRGVIQKLAKRFFREINLEKEEKKKKKNKK